MTLSITQTFPPGLTVPGIASASTTSSGQEIIADGLFRVVITVAEDVKGHPRKIEDCYPKDDWFMQITALDENTGEFRAVKIEDQTEGKPSNQ
jgi:hypothetical protein